MSKCESLLTINEASEFLGVKPSWLRLQIFQKKIKFIKLSRLIRFRKEDLEQFISQNERRQM
jgi:excisionase family DNA binding protein